MILSCDEVQKIIKHRYPILFIDKVAFIKPMKECLAIKNFSYNEWFFPSHFESEAMVPGSIQIEAYTQAVGITLLVEENKGINKDYDLLLLSVDRVRFYKSVKPGDVFKIQVKIDKIAMGIATAFASGYIDDKIVSECKIGYKIKDLINE